MSATCNPTPSGARQPATSETPLPSVTAVKFHLFVKRVMKIMKQVSKNPMGAIGMVILCFFSFIAVFGPTLAPYEVDASSLGQFTPMLQESPEHWLGTDTEGYDIFSSLLYGARTSIIVGIFAALISSFLGAVIGLYSGYVGGWKDEVVMRVNDVVLSIPWLVLMIIIAAFVGEINLMGIILIIGFTGWSGTSRLVRAQVMSIRERQYVERAKAIGAGDWHIIGHHILPNVFPLVFANTILTVAGSILAESTLSFLKMRPIGSVTWGSMLSYAHEGMAFQIGLPWWIIAPGLCIVVLVLGFTLLGYALDEVMNPKLRKR
ncbi:MAG: ABC transporter permease [Candidatus Thermoplasmatota archaeon]